MRTRLRQQPQSTILVVDDDPDYRGYARAVLEQSGYRVIEAATGGEAIDLIKRGRPSLILVDWLMPSMSGAELHDALAAHPETTEVPVGFVSAAEVPAERCRGAVFRLKKPVPPAELLAAVKAYALRDS